MAGLIVDRIDASSTGGQGHASGAFPSHVLKRLERLLPPQMKASAETGCGKSTILFSNLSESHTVFTVDDSAINADSSVTYFRNCPVTRLEKLELVFGPSQLTMPGYRGYRNYDAVLIDGPHGYPFPDMEYYHLYPHIRPGGLLLVDDIHLSTIGHLVDFIREDAMFELVDVVSTTAVFQRTDAPEFDPLGDGWWLQNYNLRRIAPGFDSIQSLLLQDGKRSPPMSVHFGQTGWRHWLASARRLLAGK